MAREPRGRRKSEHPAVRVLFQPSGLRVTVPVGTDVASAARLAGIPLGGACGGARTCGKCRILVVRGKRRETALACALRPRRSVTVEVPADTVVGAARILTGGIYVQVEPRPNVWLRDEGGKIFFVFGENGEGRPLRARPSGCYGVALDLGTTTLVASLFDLRTGTKLAVASSLDPQVSLGEDVISRINLALAEKDATERLHRVLLHEVNRLVREACARANVSVLEVFDTVAVGNTFMHHSFLGLPLKTLGEAPYVPVATQEHEMPASEVGLRIHSLGRAYLPPVVAGFLGSDALAGALAAGLDSVVQPTLYIDLGTNGELLLAIGDRILGSTTAAGPAFEGAQVECGMRASEGAISAVRLVEKAQGAWHKARGTKTQGTRRRAQGAMGESKEEVDAVTTLAPRASRHAPLRQLKIETIGGKPARGIAGSGLVDAAAALLDAGALDRRGNLVAGHPMVRHCAGAKRVVLASSPVTVYLSQGDIRSLQLAKAAVAAGTQVLLDNAGITGEEVTRVLLAGAFGNYLDRQSAMRIGLLPPVELKNVLGMGNAASTGAGMMLVSTRERRRAVEIARKIKYIELAGNDRFRELFVDCLAFP